MALKEVSTVADVLSDSVYSYLLCDEFFSWTVALGVALLKFLILRVFGQVDWHSERMPVFCVHQESEEFSQDSALDGSLVGLFQPESDILEAEEDMSIHGGVYCPFETGLTPFQKALFVFIFFSFLGGDFCIGIRLLYRSCHASFRPGIILAGIFKAGFAVTTLLVGGNYIKKTSGEFVEATTNSTVLLFVMSIDKEAKRLCDNLCPLYFARVKASIRDQDFPLVQELSDKAAEASSGNPTLASGSDIEAVQNQSLSSSREERGSLGGEEQATASLVSSSSHGRVAKVKAGFQQGDKMNDIDDDGKKALRRDVEEGSPATEFGEREEFTVPHRLGQSIMPPLDSLVPPKRTSY